MTNGVTPVLCLQQAEAEVDEDASVKKALGGKKILCRLCKGDHFTSKCPHKDVLAPLGDGGNYKNSTTHRLEHDPYLLLDTGAGPDDDGTPAGDAFGSGAGAGGGTGGKYVPPSMRAGAGRGAGESMGRSGGTANRDDLPTLRVTNVSEDAHEDDLRELFQVFGRVVRVFIGKDRETGIGKGFAFVSFEEREHAQKAIDKVNGKGMFDLFRRVIPSC